MPSIYIQTFPLGGNLYQLLQTRYIGLTPEVDKIIEWTAADRLTASIINLGLACRELHDDYRDWKSNVIEIESDTDGKDKIHGGEHDIMYSLLFPHTNYEMRKLARLYAEYDRHLSRLWALIKGAEIDIKLISREEK
jgi:hypothetical protein